MAERWRLFGPECDERRRRLWAAAEARSHGPSGVAMVAAATGISPATVYRGLEELEGDERLPAGQVRRSGGGRRLLTEQDPTLEDDLQQLVDPATRGDPESLLRWTSKSLAHLAGALGDLGHQVSDQTVGKLLRGLGFRLQANRKTREGADHPDRDQQFEHIDQTARAAIAAGQPVISVDTKKKELVGTYKAVGREYEPGGKPVEVNTHDFPDKKLGKAVPYGIYDIAGNEGFVSVGISADTAQFSVASILAWWQHLGKTRYPHATRLTINADCGGSNSYRTRLFKTELQRLADETDLQLEVCHFPPGTSKWNKIEHRLFSQIAQNWRGQPLTSYQVIIDLIASTTTSTGLKVYARLDEHEYPNKLKVTDEQLAAVNITRHAFHPEWNYVISPRLTAPP
ncbi:MAG: ISAzo13 family transposase [Actinobacteria bacterium]|nr:ISAzo13 family transposase [Actinomycetota bacterium]MCA1698787.1 ISAzo13 family transposase [Actinomycetota bacterium]